MFGPSAKVFVMVRISPFPLRKWGMRFFKNSCNGRDVNFLKSLYIVGRVVLTPLFCEDSLYCLPPSPTSLSPPTPHPHYSFCCPVSLAEWEITPHLMCYLLNDNMDLNMLSLGKLVTEGPWCTFYATRRQVYWGLTHNGIFHWYSDLILHTHEHTNTQHLLGSAHWHTHIDIYLRHLLRAHSSYIYRIKWLNEKFTDIKNLLSTMSFLFKHYSLVKVIYLLIKCYKARFFLIITNNTDGNGVNKQDTHTDTKH